MTSFSWPCLSTSTREAPECLRRFLISARSRRDAAAFSRFAWRCSGVSRGRATVLTSSCKCCGDGQSKSSHGGDTEATRLTRVIERPGRWGAPGDRAPPGDPACRDPRPGGLAPRSLHLVVVVRLDEIGGLGTPYG